MAPRCLRERLTDKRKCKWVRWSSQEKVQDYILIVVLKASMPPSPPSTHSHARKSESLTEQQSSREASLTQLYGRESSSRTAQVEGFFFCLRNSLVSQKKSSRLLRACVRAGGWMLRITLEDHERELFRANILLRRKTKHCASSSLLFNYVHLLSPCGPLWGIVSGGKDYGLRARRRA